MKTNTNKMNMKELSLEELEDVNAGFSLASIFNNVKKITTVIIDTVDTIREIF